jgi:hypothetical protein
LFEKINFALLLQARESAGREASPSAGVIDSQSVSTALVSQRESAAILNPLLVEASLLSWALSGTVRHRARMHHYSGATKQRNRSPLSSQTH